MTYTISVPSYTIRKDGVDIGKDDSTPEYQAYAEFLSAGGTPQQVPDEVHAPRLPHVTCTPWQLRKGMNATGIRSDVDAYVASLDQDSKDGFEHATSWESDHPLLIAAAPLLGMSEQGLHEFISYCATL